MKASPTTGTGSDYSIFSDVPASGHLNLIPSVIYKIYVPILLSDRNMTVEYVRKLVRKCH